MGCCQSTDQTLPRVPKHPRRVQLSQSRLKDCDIINSRKMQSVPTLHLSSNKMYTRRIKESTKTQASEEPDSPPFQD